MKTKTISVRVAVPDDGKDYSITTIVQDTTPVSQGDHDRIRHVYRHACLIKAGEKEVKPA